MGGKFREMSHFLLFVQKPMAEENAFAQFGEKRRRTVSCPPEDYCIPCS